VLTPPARRRRYTIAVAAVASLLILAGLAVINRFGKPEQIADRSDPSKAVKDRPAQGKGEPETKAATSASGTSVTEIAGSGKESPVTVEPSTDPDRRAAEYVLSIGGTINITENGMERQIGAVGDLPTSANKWV